MIQKIWLRSRISYKGAKNSAQIALNALNSLKPFSADLVVLNGLKLSKQFRFNAIMIKVILLLIL